MINVNVIVFFLCRLYATKVMIGCVESELKAMRSGLHDVIPAELLTPLTPEVSRLLMASIRNKREY